MTTVVGVRAEALTPTVAERRLCSVDYLQRRQVEVLYVDC
jgi:hypothetical protein